MLALSLWWVLGLLTCSFFCEYSSFRRYHVHRTFKNCSSSGKTTCSNSIPNLLSKLSLSSSPPSSSPLTHLTLTSNNSLREPKLVLPTIVSGLTCYFDRSLGANLLYRFERPQYAGIRKEYITGSHVIVGQEKEMSQVYGPEHFLRMIGGLGSSFSCHFCFACLQY